MWLVPRKKEENLWDPFQDFSQIHNQMLKVFDAPFLRGFGDFALLGDGEGPAVDIEETKDNLIVRADLQGLNKEEIAVSVREGSLTLKGGKKVEQEVKEENYVRQERAYGSFYRTIPLPSEVDVTKAKAVYKNGVLELTLPKKEEAKSKEVDIDLQ